MVLSQDDFVLPEEHIPQIKDRTDWEHPDSINWSAWQRAIDSNQEDCDYLILEGLFAFQPMAKTTKVSHQYYLSMEKDAFIEERKREQRWGFEPLWFIEHVWESHFIHGLPDEPEKTRKYHNIRQQDYPAILNQITS